MVLQSLLTAAMVETIISLLAFSLKLKPCFRTKHLSQSDSALRSVIFLFGCVLESEPASC